MNRSVPTFPGFALLAIAFLSGCQTEYYRWQTVVNPDGSVVRTVSHPSVPGPDEPTDAQESEGWETRGFHKEMDRNVWPERITGERINSTLPEYEKELNYIIEQGTFENLDQVPQHYRFELEGTDLASEVKHNLTINDYALVKEYVWVEEITDIVKYEDVPAARREMIKLLSAVVQEGLQQGLGDDYDVSELIRWIETEGDQLVEELTLVLLSRELHDLDEAGRQKRLDAVAARYGITKLTDEGIQLFVRERLQKGVKRKNGQPLEAEIIDALVDDPNDNDDGENAPNKYQEAIKTAWKKHVGGENDKPNKLQVLLAKQVGVHAVPLIKNPQKFDIWLKLPGEVIETNGVLEEEGFLKWSFSDEEIWPTGYRMTARSVMPVKVRNSQVLRTEKLGSSRDMLKFLRLVKTDEELLESVRTCLEQNSLEPLQAIEKQRRDGAGSPPPGRQIKTEQQAKWWSARQLLDLLNQDPPAAK